MWNWFKAKTKAPAMEYTMRLYTDAWVEASHSGYRPKKFFKIKTPFEVEFTKNTGSGPDIKYVGIFDKNGEAVMWSSLDTDVPVVVDSSINVTCPWPMRNTIMEMRGPGKTLSAA